LVNGALIRTTFGATTDISYIHKIATDIDPTVIAASKIVYANSAAMTNLAYLAGIYAPSAPVADLKNTVDSLAFYFADAFVKGGTYDLKGGILARLKLGATDIPSFIRIFAEVSPLHIAKAKDLLAEAAVVADLKNIALAYDPALVSPKLDEAVNRLALRYAVEFSKGGRYQLSKGTLVQSALGAVNEKDYIARIAADIPTGVFAKAKTILADSSASLTLEKIAKTYAPVLSVSELDNVVSGLSIQYAGDHTKGGQYQWAGDTLSRTLFGASNETDYVQKVFEKISTPDVSRTQALLADSGVITYLGDVAKELIPTLSGSDLDEAITALVSGGYSVNFAKSATMEFITPALSIINTQLMELLNEIGLPVLITSSEKAEGLRKLFTQSLVKPGIAEVSTYLGGATITSEHMKLLTAFLDPERSLADALNTALGILRVTPEMAERIKRLYLTAAGSVSSSELKAIAGADLTEAQIANVEAVFGPRMRYAKQLRVIFGAGVTADKAGQIAHIVSHSSPGSIPDEVAAVLGISPAAVRTSLEQIKALFAPSMESARSTERNIIGSYAASLKLGLQNYATNAATDSANLISTDITSALGINLATLKTLFEDVHTGLIDDILDLAGYGITDPILAANIMAVIIPTPANGAAATVLLPLDEYQVKTLISFLPVAGDFTVDTSVSASDKARIKQLYKEFGDAVNESQLFKEVTGWRLRVGAVNYTGSLIPSAWTLSADELDKLSLMELPSSYLPNIISSLSTDLTDLSVNQVALLRRLFGRSMNPTGADIGNAIGRTVTLSAAQIEKLADLLQPKRQLAKVLAKALDASGLVVAVTPDQVNKAQALYESRTTSPTPAAIEAIFGVSAGALTGPRVSTIESLLAPQLKTTKILSDKTGVAMTLSQSLQVEHLFRNSVGLPNAENVRAIFDGQAGFSTGQLEQIRAVVAPEYFLAQEIAKWIEAATGSSVGVTPEQAKRVTRLFEGAPLAMADAVLIQQALRLSSAPSADQMKVLQKLTVLDAGLVVL
ncbi:MAG: hypothetical protein COT00_03910, partial [Candidatus Omnitrophica bacterium CG07_land_8_20_14_0_80_50_8]